MEVNKNKIQEMCEHLSKRELLASKAERDSIKYKQAEFLEDKIGQIFQGLISGVTNWGIYVELVDSKCEGFIKQDGQFNIDIENYTVHRKNGGILRLGDEIAIKVKNINLEKKQIDFVIL